MRVEIRPAAGQARLIRSVVALAAALVLCIGFATALDAAGRPAPEAAPRQEVFTVNSTGDLGDAEPGDGFCDDGEESCSLRAAIEEANTAEGPVTIVFDLPLPATINLGSVLMVRNSIAILGPTVGVLTLNGLNESQHFDIGPGLTGPVAVTIKHLTLLDGGSGEDGGSVFIPSTEDGVDVTFERVVFRSNFAVGRGGALFAEAHSVRVIDSLFEDNTAASGGAIANHGGSVRVERSSLVGNHAEFGGALFNTDYGTIQRHGVMTVTVSSLADNDALTRGGALYNESQEGYGAATWVRGSTMARNRVSNGSPVSAGGGAFNGAASTLVLNNSIMAGNRREDGDLFEWDDCYSQSNGPGAPPVNGRGASPNSYLTGGDNVVGSGASDGCAASPGDIEVDPAQVFLDVLHPELASYDGSQPMFALLPGSPAIDVTAGGSRLCGGALSVDQRGAPKPLGNACDAGAYEAALPKIVISRTLSTNAQTCTGQQALELATGAIVHACATVVNEGNVALTGTVIGTGAGQPFRLSQPLLPGQAITLTARELPALQPKVVASDTTEALEGQGSSPWSTPPGVDRQATGLGESRARPVDVTMKVTAKPFGFGAIRTVTATVSYHPVLGVIPQRLVKMRVSGGTSALLPTQQTSTNGETTFSYISFSPLTPANGAARGVKRSSRLAVSPTALQATDTIEVWVDYNPNGEHDPFEPYTTAGLPTAITLASFEAQVIQGTTVLVRWRTGSELDLVGFTLLRASQADGPYALVTTAPGQGSAVLGSEYEYTDSVPGPGTYYYKLEEVDVNGARLLHGPVVVDVTAPVQGDHVLWLPWIGN